VFEELRAMAKSKVEADDRADGAVRGSFVVVVGIATGLCVGFLDIAFSALPAPLSLGSISVAGPALATTVCAFALLYAIVWYAVLTHVGRHYQLQRGPLAVSFSFAVLTIFGLGKMIGGSFDPNSYLRWAIALAVTGVVALGVYQMGATLRLLSPRTRTTVRLVGAIPFMSAVTMVFVWLEIYRIGAFSSVSSILLCIVYAVVLLVAIRWFRRRFAVRAVSRIVVALFVFVVAGGIADTMLAHHAESPVSTTSTSDHKIKHVFLITIDTLRRDALSCYNPGGADTPHIDQLANDAVIYDRAYSPSPWTLPSLASIMTGVSPLVHGAMLKVSRVPRALRTLGEYMRDAGYYTAIVGWSGILSPQYNVVQGFMHEDIYPKTPSGGTVGEAIAHRWLRAGSPVEPSTRVLTDVSVDWIEANVAHDSFMWIHYLDPHQPYEPPAEYLPDEDPPERMGNRFMVANVMKVPLEQTPGVAQRKWVRSLYDAEVRYVDDNVGRFVSTLKELGIYDESLIILTSDHGEEFWEHGRFEHGHSLYNELVGVPLLIKPPKFAGHKRYDGVVSNGSIMPTVAALCGIDVPDSSLSYQSISRTFQPNAQERREAHAFCTGVMYYQQKEAIIFHDRKYIRSLATGREELYDLEEDPDEQYPIETVSPGDIEDARAALDHYCEQELELRSQLGITTQKVTGTDDILRRLRSLGYM
jgi:arylsulfatase A-like enzyme